LGLGCATSGNRAAQNLTGSPLKKVVKSIFLDFLDCEEHNFAHIARGRAFFHPSDLFIRLSAICINPILGTKRQQILNNGLG